MPSSNSKLKVLRAIIFKQNRDHFPLQKLHRDRCFILMIRIILAGIALLPAAGGGIWLAYVEIGAVVVATIMDPRR